MLKYTICLIKRRQEILLLNRNKKPLMGMWNGVGGKIENDETPHEGAIRETIEETDGMYLFVADLADDFEFQTPFNTREGILEWKAIDWILDSNNRGVISNLKEYLPKILENEEILEHAFLYDNYIIKDYSVSLLEENNLSN